MLMLLLDTLNCLRCSIEFSYLSLSVTCLDLLRSLWVSEKKFKLFMAIHVFIPSCCFVLVALPLLSSSIHRTIDPSVRPSIRPSILLMLLPFKFLLNLTWPDPPDRLNWIQFSPYLYSFPLSIQTISIPISSFSSIHPLNEEKKMISSFQINIIQQFKFNSSSTHTSQVCIKWNELNWTVMNSLVLSYPISSCVN